MTTIAANTKMVAGDTLVNDGGTRSKGTKVFKNKRAIIGVAGDYVQARLFAMWFADRRRRQPDPDANFEALVLWPDGKLETWFPDLTSVPVEDEHWAIGSGRDAALAAMKSGAAPNKAVEIACDVDMNTGRPVTYEEF